MAYNAQNGGVYILINGDATPLQRTLERLKTKVSDTAKQIEAQMQGVFGRADISRVANTAISAFARLRTSVRAIETDIQGQRRAWESYGRQIGLADEQAQRLAETINRSLREKNIRQIESSLRTLQRQTGMATSEVIRLAREMGAVEVAGRKAFSELGIRSGAQIRSEIKNIVSAYAELRKSGTATAQDLARAQAAMRQRVAELRTELNGIQPTANQAYESLKRIGLATVSITAVTVSVKSLIDAVMELDSLKIGYQGLFGIEDKSVGTAQLSYIYDITQKLGLEFKSTAEAAKGFFATAQGTTLEKDMHAIFEGFSEGASALQLSSDKVKGIFLALGQMVSKGKVSMEELRQQLGEHLPGAFKMAAAAMGVTTQQFDKMVSSGQVFAEDLLPKMAKAVHDQWGAVAEASNPLQSEINRLNNEWMVFKANLLDTEAVKKGVEGIRVALKNLDSVVKTLSENKEVIFAAIAGVGAAGGIALMAKYASAIGNLGTTLTTLAVQAKTAAAGLMTFLVANPWVAVATAIGTATAALVYFTEKADAAAQAQKILTSAQAEAVEINKVLQDQAKATLAQAEAELKSAQEQYQAMVVQNDSILKSLADSIHMESVLFGEARANVDKFTYALEELALQTAKTGDFSTLERGIRSIEAQAKTAGEETDTFRKYVEKLQAICSAGVNLHVQMTGYQEIMSKLLNLISFKRALGDTADPNARQKEIDTINRQYGAALTSYSTTSQGKKESNAKQIQKYKDLRKKFVDDKSIKELGISAKEATERVRVLDVLINDLEGKNYKLGGSAKKAGNSGVGAAKRMANAQGTYNTALETTQDHIESLQEQLKLDKTQTVAQKKIALENKYAAAIAKTTEQIQKQIRSGSISAEQGKKLIALKQEENSLELQLKIREMEDKAIQENLSHLQEQLSFYNELAGMSGNYITSMELQNKIIDIQAQKYRDLKTIPEEMISEWTKWKKLQASTDPFDGAYRGLLKFQAEFGNSAKQWEDLTYNFAKNFENTSHQMFDDFLETGKLSFDSIGKLFKQLLKDMAYYALVQPIVLSTVGGFAGTSGSINGAVNGSSTGSNLTNAAAGLAQSAILSKAGGGLMGAAGNFLNSTAASLFPNTFAANEGLAAIGSEINGFTSAGLPTQTATGMLGSGWTMGAGLLGGAIGNYLLVPALGIKGGTGTSIGGMVGGAAGSIGGGLLGAAALGATFGSAAGPIGAGIGALIGTVAGAFGGSLFGGEELEPGYYINAWTDLTSKKGLQGYKSGTATQNHRWDGFPSGTAAKMRDEVARPIMDQLRTTTSEIKGQLKTVGGDALGKSFFDAVRKYQKSPSKNTGKYGEDLSQFFQIHGEWGDTTSPDIETWTKNLTKQYQEVIVKSIANMDMTPITKAADGFVANTEEEIAVALVKAGQLIAVGDTIDDEELKESFQTGISKSLISALKKIDTSKLGLKIDKSSLEGWVVAAQAMQKWQEVNNTLDAMIDPASEIENQFNTLNQQFVEWSATLKELGWNSSKVREVDRKRITYVKQYAEEVISGFEAQDEYVAKVKEINDAFNDVAAGLKTNGINADTLKVTERRDTVLRDYIDSIFAQFETTSEYNQTIKSIEDEFASAIAAMKEASDTFTDAEIQNAQKMRDALIKEQQDTVRASVKDSLGQYDVISDAQSAFNEVSKAFAEIIETMKAASGAFSIEEIESVQKKGSEVLKRQADDMLAQYDSMSDIEQSIKEIGTHFADVIDAMKSVSDTFSAADIEAAEKKSAEILRKQVSDLAKQYDNVSDAEQNLVGISEYFADLTAAMKSAVGVFGKADFVEIQKKSADAMRRYVSSITDGYKKTTALKQATDEINRTFDNLISAMKKVGMSVEEVTTVERQRANALADLRAETLRGYNQDLDKRYNTLKNGADTDTTSLLNLWYSQNNELEEIADAIGRNNVQYKTTVQVQQAEYLQSQIEILQKQLKTLLQDQLTAATSALNNAVSLKNTFSSVVRTLKTALRNLWTSEENLTGTRYSEAYKQFNETYQKAIAGDTDALNELPEIGSTVLALAKEQVSTRGEYDTAFYDITKRIKKASDYAGKQLLIAEKEEAKQQSLVNSINAKIEAANGGTAKAVNGSVESLQYLIADYQKRLADILSDISDNTGIISDNIVVLRSLNDGTAKSRNAILGVKSELMKYGETIGDRQLTQAELAKYGNMTSEEVLASIEATGMSFDEWYQRYGVKEFDEAAKRAGIVVNSIDDLRKITDAYDKLLAAKADSLNKQMVASGEVAAGGWTAQKVLEAINKSGLTVAQWYEQFGRAEGFTLNAAKTTNGIITNLGEFLEKSIGKLNDGSSTSKQAIIDTKVQLMKYGEAVWKGQLSQAQREAAANMTSAQILKSIEDSGLTFDEWYNKYGSKELIEAAKNAGVVIESIEDLHKITDSYDRLLAQKADALNSSMYTTAKVAAGGWTSDLVRQEILSRGMTVKEWYDKYGKSEGFLLNIFGTSKTLDTDVKSQTSTLNNSITKGAVDYSNVLKQKADVLNASMYKTANVAAGGWTATKVEAEIKSRGMTVAEWYAKYGKSEGYLLSSVNAENAVKNAIETQTKSLRDAILGLNNGSSANKNAILETKAALMKYGEALGKGQLTQEQKIAAGNATSQSVLASIQKNGLSFNDWYTKYGSKEIEQAAKNAGVVVNSIGDLKKITDAYDNLLAKKADTLNSSMYSTASIAAGGWTADKVREEINSRGMTVKEWYDKYGKSEGYLLNTQNNTGNTNTSVKDGLANLSTYLNSKFSSMSDMLDAKVASLNQSAYLGKTNWTVAEAVAKMEKEFGSVDNWFNSVGKNESFAQSSSTSNKSTSSNSTSSQTSSSTSTSSSSNKSTSSSKTTTSTASKTTSTAAKSTSSTSRGSNFAGSKYKTESDLLNAKVASLNKQKYQGRSNWTAAQAKAEMVKSYGSVAGWYIKKGRSEGFATGGITPRNMPFWVGERGPELMMSPQSYGVLNNRDSMNLMRGLYTSSSNDDYLYFAINETNNVLRQTLRKVDQMEYDLHRNRMYLQKWDTDGLPATSV